MRRVLQPLFNRNVLEKNVRCCKPHTREIDQVIQRDILLTLIKIFEVCEAVLSRYKPYKVFLGIEVR